MEASLSGAGLKGPQWLRNRNVAVDLGTTTTRIYRPGQDLIFSEPSVLALHPVSKEMLALGKEARHLVGRAPAGVIISKPLRQGMICDFDGACALLGYFLRKAVGHWMILRPHIVIAVSSQATSVERRAVVEAVRRNSSEALMVPKGVMAAIGAGLPVFKSKGSMIIDIGGGAIEIATVSLGAVIASCVIREAGEAMDQAIMDYVKDKKQVVIGECRAELIKTSLGLGLSLKERQEMEIVGRDVRTGLPKAVSVSNIDVRTALDHWLRGILIASRSVLEETPPEISADIGGQGILLSGGGALLKNLDEFLSAELGIPVTSAPDPFACVIRGLASALHAPSLLYRTHEGLISSAHAA